MYAKKAAGTFEMTLKTAVLHYICQQIDWLTSCQKNHAKTSINYTLETKSLVTFIVICKNIYYETVLLHYAYVIMTYMCLCSELPAI